MAWLSRDIVIMLGLSLQASPSTCIGIVLAVIIRAVRHCVMQVPCPPACNKGCECKQTSVRLESWLQSRLEICLCGSHPNLLSKSFVAVLTKVWWDWYQEDGLLLLWAHTGPGKFVWKAAIWFPHIYSQDTHLQLTFLRKHYSWASMNFGSSK